MDITFLALNVILVLADIAAENGDLRQDKSRPERSAKAAIGFNLNIASDSVSRKKPKPKPKPKPTTTTTTKPPPCAGYYAKEKVCITVRQDVLSWSGARESCQATGGDLVQIWDKAKEAFVKGERNKVDADHPYWIGVSDRDVDGTYEYVNGTKVNSEAPGVGDWSKATPPRGTEEMCVVLGASDNGWETQICAENIYMYICEKYITSHTKITRDSTACTLDECTCNPSNWVTYGTRYFKVNKVAKKYSDAEDICEMLGGHLVVISDEATHTFVKDMNVKWDPKGLYYWIGLVKDDNRWMWINGKQVMYQNWFVDASSGDGCVVAIWDYRGKWRTTKCGSQHYHICETSRTPCAAHASFSVNHKNVLSSNLDMKVTNDHTVKLRCVARGNQIGVAKMKIHCFGGDSNVTLKTTGNGTAEMGLNVTIGMHQMTCECEMIDPATEANIDSTNFHTDVITEPCLSKTKKKALTVRQEFGKEVVIRFVIYANPKPDVLNLTRKGNGMMPQNYTLMLTPLPKEPYYNVTFKIESFNPNHTGTYILTIGNGVGNDLEYTFSLKEPSTDDTWARYLSTYLIIFLPILVLLILVLVLCCCCKKKRKSSGREKQPEMEDDIPESAHESKDASTAEDEKAPEPPPEPVKSRFGRYLSTIII